MSDNSRIIKRIPLNRETHKFLKKMAIDLDLDNDGAIKPEIIGECIDRLVSTLTEKESTSK
jgi:hypothetical protein